MRTAASRARLILVGLYLSFFFANCLYVAYRVNYAPENSEFAAFGVVVLTLPWCMLLDSLFDATSDAGSLAGLFRFGLYALLNASILYALLTGIIALSNAGEGRRR